METTQTPAFSYGGNFSYTEPVETVTPRKTPTVHNPTNFNPNDYEVMAYLDNRRPVCGRGESFDEYVYVVEEWTKEMVYALGADYAQKMHKCIHCGNGTVRWITATRHIPTGDLVVFGAICTGRLGFIDRKQFQLALIQARAETRKVKLAAYLKREEFLEANPSLRTIMDEVETNPVHANNNFVKDVLSKLGIYGSLSERQVAAVVTSMAQDVSRAAVKAAEALEVKGDAPTGRVEVTGVVLSTKVVESVYGYTTKMLVKLDNNSKVWATVPSGSDVKRGDRISVKATWEVSKDDKSFAFGKRPIVTITTPATV